MDGLPPVAVRAVESTFQSIPKGILLALNVDLETKEGTRAPFLYNRPTFAHEDTSYWGVIGFGLIWITVLISIVRAKHQPVVALLSSGFLIFFVLQSFVGPYDPWRGRYFTMAAPFALPSLGMCLNARHSAIRGYVLLICSLGCISAVSSIVLRANSFVLPVEYKGKRYESAFAMSRIEQLTRNRPKVLPVFLQLEEKVPANATVALFHGPDRFEYPLFGKGLTRTIVPIYSFMDGLLPLPEKADFLLYSADFPCADTQNDLYLGLDYYLRDLSKRKNQTAHCIAEYRNRQMK